MVVPRRTGCLLADRCLCREWRCERGCRGGCGDAGRRRPRPARELRCGGRGCGARVLRAGGERIGAWRAGESTARVLTCLTAGRTHCLHSCYELRRAGRRGRPRTSSACSASSQGWARTTLCRCVGGVPCQRAVGALGARCTGVALTPAAAAAGPDVGAYHGVRGHGPQSAGRGLREGRDAGFVTRSIRIYLRVMCACRCARVRCARSQEL